MHRRILGAALLASGALGLSVAGAPARAAAAPKCAAPKQIVERFISADCAECWSGDGLQDPAGAAAWDWIVPAGEEAPMAMAALREAAERLARAGAPAPTPSRGVAQRSVRPAGRTLRLDVSAGPAWHGYFGTRLQLRDRAPRGATGWVALVEELPAGAEGSAVARRLLRSVAGPLALHGAPPHDHWQALRWPESAQVQRLKVLGWVESADGRLLAWADGDCAPG